jgi:hypothetical protein
MVAAVRPAAVGEVVPVHRRDDDVVSPSLAPPARRSGSDGSSGWGSPVLTLQKAQARVQVSPMISMVAWRPAQHSAMLGQPASSHTVCSPCSRRIARVSANCGEDAGTLTRIQSGLRSTGVSGLWAFSGCRGGRLSRMVTMDSRGQGIRSV